MLYLQFRKTYLMFLAELTAAIKKGDAEAAEQYPKLEDAWQRVERWRNGVPEPVVSEALPQQQQDFLQAEGLASVPF